MTFSALTGGRTKPLNYWRRPSDGKLFRRYDDRRGQKVDLFIVHHAAGGDSALFGAYMNQGRQLSSTYAMAADGTLYGVVGEQHKPNTSSSKADYRAVTIEVANSGGEKGAGNPESWRISDAAFDQLARLIADVATRHGFPIDRQHVIGHREVRARFGDGITTRCPGEWLWARMDELVTLARKYQNENAATAAIEEEEDVMDWKDRYLLGLIAASQGRVEAAVVGQSKQLDELQEAVSELNDSKDAPPTAG